MKRWILPFLALTALTTPALAQNIDLNGATAPLRSAQVGGKAKDGKLYPLTVGGDVVGGTTTRPADTTAYAIGDLIANSTTAGSVTPITVANACRIAGLGGDAIRFRLSTSQTGLAGTEMIRVHLFKNSPTVANGDNGAFSVNGVAAIEIGIADVTLDRVYTDGSKGVGVPSFGPLMRYECAAASTSIYALLEARVAFTPSSAAVFTLAVEAWPD